MKERTLPSLNYYYCNLHSEPSSWRFYRWWSYPSSQFNTYQSIPTLIPYFWFDFSIRYSSPIPHRRLYGPPPRREWKEQPRQMRNLSQTPLRYVLILIVLWALWALPMCQDSHISHRLVVLMLIELIELCNGCPSTHMRHGYHISLRVVHLRALVFFYRILQYH